MVLLSVDMQTGYPMQRLILMEWNISLRLMTMRTVFTVDQMVFLSASGLLRSRRQMRLSLR